MSWSKIRALGQHHLIDKRILKEIIELSQINKEEVVCEAGTGEGILTQELCKQAKTVISFEIDKALYVRALSYLSDLSNLLLINANIFKIKNVDFHVFVSNLPYSRSKDAIEWLALRKFGRAIVMFQKEFVNKLKARPGETNYRSVSVICQYCFRIDSLIEVNRKSFLPRPQIDSQVVRLTPYKDNCIDIHTLKTLNYIFSFRNKKASSVAKTFGTNLSSDLNLNNKRIDQLTPQDLVSLAESLKYIVSK
ncbi:MAG TPA: 16S rRNA (adenine(1518)-N(6)/adenine(1519)-N(6))-dimethyltransferase RsmA [Nitrososphaeraceae archaeon]|nr:16S rRNA (adenine(1518)-N(6)/adenine(1519)-N(6))-dimethyltransferase RsmA [Nitrososphaeraceae archaeon]